MPAPPLRPRSLERLDRREGFFPAASPSPAAPQARPALSPPPESITTAGQRCPRLSQARPLPLRTSLRTERKPSGPVPHSPGVVSGKSCGPRLARELQLSTNSGAEGSGRCPLPSPRAAGLVPIGVRNLPLFLYHNFLKHSRSEGRSPPALPIFSPPPQPTETDCSVK